MMGNLMDQPNPKSGSFSESTHDLDLPEDSGIMPRSFSHLFSAVKSQQTRQQNVRFLIRCSFIEIYNEELRDLLAVETKESTLPGATKKKLEIKET
jgi:hypothetical protein